MGNIFKLLSTKDLDTTKTQCAVYKTMSGKWEWATCPDFSASECPSTNQCTFQDQTFEVVGQCPVFVGFSDESSEDLFTNLDYIGIQNGMEDAPINLAEVEVFDENGTNVAPLARLEFYNDTYHPAGPIANLTNGNLNDFAHSKNNNGFIKMFWDNEHLNITKVVVHNRKDDCCKNRIVGGNIEVMGDNFVKQWTGSFDTEQETYTFYPR